jgi:hypothetical protein
MQIPFTIKGETIFLCCDDNNYTLAKIRERNRGDQLVNELENFKWFASLEGALNRLIDLKVKSSDAKSLIELKQVIESARDEVTQAWSGQGTGR